jgi:hypothetical protein
MTNEGHQEPARAAAEAALQGVADQFAAQQDAFRDLVQAQADRQGVRITDAKAYVPNVAAVMDAALPDAGIPLGHLSAEGLEARVTAHQAALEALRASMRQAVISARQSGYLTDESRDAALEALGLEPLQEVTRVKVSSLSFTIAEDIGEEKATALVTDAFQRLLGDGVTVTKVSAKVSRETV